MKNGDLLEHCITGYLHSAYEGKFRESYSLTVYHALSKIRSKKEVSTLCAAYAALEIQDLLMLDNAQLLRLVRAAFGKGKKYSLNRNFIEMHNERSFESSLKYVKEFILGWKEIPGSTIPEDVVLATGVSASNPNKCFYFHRRFILDIISRIFLAGTCVIECRFGDPIEIRMTLRDSGE